MPRPNLPLLYRLLSELASSLPAAAAAPCDTVFTGDGIARAIVRLDGVTVSDTTTQIPVTEDTCTRLGWDPAAPSVFDPPTAHITQYACAVLDLTRHQLWTLTDQVHSLDSLHQAVGRIVAIPTLDVLCDRIEHAAEHGFTPTSDDRDLIAHARNPYTEEGESDVWQTAPGRDIPLRTAVLALARRAAAA